MYEFRKHYLNCTENYDDIYNFVMINIVKPKKENNKIYISKSERDFLLKYKICYYNNNFYVIERELLKKAKIRIHKQKDILSFFEPYPNMIIDNDKNLNSIKYYNNYLKAMHEYPEYFIENYSHTINYNNHENLKYIKEYLIKGVQITNIPTYKSGVCTNIDFWIFRGWDYETAKRRVHEYQKNNAEKYAKKLKENPEKYWDCFNTRIEFYIKRGYSYEDAKIMLKRRSATFSREKCIEKYGIDRGLEIFNKRQEKWQNTLKNKENYVEILISRQNYKGYSGISQEFFNELDKNISHLNVKAFYATKNHEYGIGIKGVGGALYDFVIPELKYAIEFNGEAFHPRRDKLDDFEWKNWFNPYSKETADVSYEKDMNKIMTLKDKGFDVDIIWDSDYLSNKKGIIDNITNKIILLYEKRKTCKR